MLATDTTSAVDLPATYYLGSSGALYLIAFVLEGKGAIIRNPIELRRTINLVVVGASFKRRITHNDSPLSVLTVGMISLHSPSGAWRLLSDLVPWIWFCGGRYVYLASAWFQRIYNSDHLLFTQAWKLC